MYKYEFKHMVLFHVRSENCMIEYIKDEDYNNIVKYIDINNFVFNFKNTHITDKCENICNMLETGLPYLIIVSIPDCQLLEAKLLV